MARPGEPMKEKTKIAVAAVTAVFLVAAVCTGAYVLVNRDKYFSGKGTSEPTSSAAPETTTQRFLSGVDIAEYDISFSKLGNLIGNLNNKAHGIVTYKGNYDYHSVENVGIFSFDKNTEVSSLILGGETGEFYYQYLNAVGSSLYFIDVKTGVLYTCTTSGKNKRALAENVSALFVYGDDVYYISGGVYRMRSDGSDNVLLMEKTNDETFEIVGISNTRLYFSCTSAAANEVKWYSVNVGRPQDCKEFFSPTGIGELAGTQYTEGWFYYSRYDGDHSNIYRVRVGEDTPTETIAENVRDFVVKINCIYYGRIEGDGYHSYEINTDSKDVKVVSMAPAGALPNTMETFMGGEYVYAIGESGGQKTAARTCIYTAANLIMLFNYQKNSWSFV